MCVISVNPLSQQHFAGSSKVNILLRRILPMTLNINPVFKNHVPPLSPEVYENLENSIKADGCLVPIVTWNGTIVDGIEAVEIMNNLSGDIFNLNGQKLQKAQKGINIINGKKVMVK